MERLYPLMSFCALRFSQNTFENRVFGKNVSTGMDANMLDNNGLRRQKSEFFDLVSTLFRFVFDPVSSFVLSRRSCLKMPLSHYKKETYGTIFMIVENESKTG